MEAKKEFYANIYLYRLDNDKRLDVEASLESRYNIKFKEITDTYFGTTKEKDDVPVFLVAHEYDAKRVEPKFMYTAYELNKIFNSVVIIPYTEHNFRDSSFPSNDLLGLKKSCNNLDIDYDLEPTQFIGDRIASIYICYLMKKYNISYFKYEGNFEGASKLLKDSLEAFSELSSVDYAKDVYEAAMVYYDATPYLIRGSGRVERVNTYIQMLSFLFMLEDTSLFSGENDNDCTRNQASLVNALK